MKRITRNKIAAKDFICLALLGTLAWSANMDACMAAVAPNVREEQNQRNLRENARKQEQQSRKDVFLQTEKAGQDETELPEEEQSFLISSIELTGEESKRFSWLESELMQYQGRKIGLAGIEAVIKIMENKLIDRGYATTHLLIPEQDLSTGVLKLRLAVGRIHDIRFLDANAKDNWRTAFPARPGDILNIRDLEQGLEQLKRIRSRDVKMRLAPAGDLGESDVIIEALHSANTTFMTSISDNGSEATGKLQMNTAVKIDDPFNANDILQIQMNFDAQRDGYRRGTRGKGVQYSIPDGNWTYSLSYNDYRYHQTVMSNINELIFSGKSEDYRFHAEKLLTRSQTGKTYLELGVNRKQSRSYIEDAEILVQRKKTAALDLGLYHRQYIGDALLDINIGLKSGMPWFHAQDDLSRLNDALPTTRYRIWNWDTFYQKPISFGKAKGQYRCSFSGQYTKDRLYAADCISLGGRYTVRGFDGEQTLLGDSGFYVQNELSVELNADSQLFAGIDCGRVSGEMSEYNSSKYLSGAVLGFRGQTDGLQYEVFVGWPLKKPAELKADKQTYGFQLAYTI